MKLTHYVEVVHEGVPCHHGKARFQQDVCRFWFEDTAGPAVDFASAMRKQRGLTVNIVYPPWPLVLADDSAALVADTRLGRPSTA